jgi:hypothetical protein
MVEPHLIPRRGKMVEPYLIPGGGNGRTVPRSKEGQMNHTRSQAEGEMPRIPSSSTET